MVVCKIPKNKKNYITSQNMADELMDRDDNRPVSNLWCGCSELDIATDP
jgi:hypothetical protein